jgi:hypothetical protein
MTILGMTAGCAFEGPSINDETIPANTGIINGDHADANSAISRSTVYVNLPNGNFCTGVLLNDHVVLTAAHCTNHGMPTSITIRSADVSCFAAAVSDFSTAPKLTGNTFAPDLALLKLAKAVCKPAPVVFAATPKENETLSGAGFGFGNITGLDFLKMKVINSDKEYLKALYLKGYEKDPEVQDDLTVLEEYYAEFSEMYVFALAQNKTQSLCHGDSGGPIYREQNGVLTILGVIGGGLPHSKKGVPDCQNTYLQVFAPIGPSMEWLTTTLKSW